MHISFICKGNICRSPMAASVARTYLRQAGLDDRVMVSSGGIEGWNAGKPADQRAIAALSRHGYQTEHSASQVNPTHLGADLLVAMDESHREALLREVDPSRVRLLREFTSPSVASLDVPDPYEGEASDFESTLHMIEAAMPGLIAWIREGISGPVTADRLN
ncbi:low molecular weight protein-tyrosine-phosphatase [Streptosporangium roseum]|uniref:low molecular weight protein-tyrosine-phosphatase n=1 Tax=Streptosporangium roseum TaxID=2001 RepID=UPI003324AED3